MNFERLKQRIMGSVRSIVRRGTITVSGDEIQTQTFEDTARTAEYLQPYGLHARPPAGSRGLILAVGADTAVPVAIMCAPSGEPDVEVGEVALWHTSGSRVVLRNDGSIELTPADGQVVKLGGEAATLAVARETDPTSTPALDDLHAVLAGWTPVATDGGAALKTALATWLTTYASTAGDGTIAAGGEGATAT